MNPVAVITNRIGREGLGVSRAGCPETPDAAGGLEGCEAGGKGFPISAKCCPAQYAEGLRRGFAAKIWGYCQSTKGAEPQQRFRNHDLCAGRFAASGEVPEAPQQRGTKKQLTNPWELCMMVLPRQERRQAAAQRHKTNILLRLTRVRSLRRKAGA